MLNLPCVCNVTLKTVTSRSREISPTEPRMVCRRAESVDSFRREVIVGDSDRWQICVYIYIYGTPPKPMQTSILVVFTVNFIYFGTDFVPIKFEAPTVGKLKNWKTEKLKNWIP